jgi:hypothetical protein
MSEKLRIASGADPRPAHEAPAVAPGLLLHKFVKAESWRGALTPDSTGANLPLHGSAWIYAKEVVVSPSDRRVGATALQIANGISERGYFLLPIADDV